MADDRRDMAGLELRLRPATDADCGFAFRVWKAAMEQYVEATWGWDESSQRRRQREEFRASAYRIMEVSGCPVGTLIAERRPDHIYLSGLYILPEYQGRGLGSRVLGDLSAEGETHNLPIRLRVLKVNSDARRLYERTGFIATDETDACFVVMEKTP